MKNQFNLEINKPCSENFNNFTPTTDGGFCANCKKEVIDFSDMNSNEIINYFKERSNQDTCGKFKSNQLKTYSKNKSKKNNLWSEIGIACLAFFSLNTIQAQSEPLKQQTSETTIKLQEKEIIVKGNVSDDTGSLPGVSVVLQGSMITTETDFDGKFKFPKALKKGDILVFSFIGLESRKVVINNTNSASNIELNVDMKLSTCIVLGKIAVNKVYKSKRK